MSFTDKQARALKSKLSYLHVKTRMNNGATISYVEGWHVISEANRIFGYDCWDRTTFSPKLLWSEMHRGQTVCFYTTKVRITVHAGETTVVREGIGTGLGRAASAEAAHEIALKAAETDATKRALATFGNPFGLALYDKDRTKVTRPVKKGETLSRRPNITKQRTPCQELILRKGKRSEQRFDDAQAFVDATMKVISGLSTIECLYAFWEQNLTSFSALKVWTTAADEDLGEKIVAALKGRARTLGTIQVTKSNQGKANGAVCVEAASEPRLAFPKEKRIRDKAHLAFVARQPCLVCGRRPAQAHHLRFAQPRAMALKVSDEFTVPLCNGHHDSLHRTGDERAWWARNGILDPLNIAARLWAAPQKNASVDDTASIVSGNTAAHPSSASKDREKPVDSSTSVK